jgi:hypothetical protein
MVGRRARRCPLCLGRSEWNWERAKMEYSRDLFLGIMEYGRNLLAGIMEYGRPRFST